MPHLIALLALGLALGPPASPAAADEHSGDALDGTHAPLTLVDGRLRAGIGEETEEVPDVTAYCNSCHGSETARTESEAAAHPSDSAARDHPVDIAYPGADPDYRSPGALDSRLLLLDGRVTCVTCHAHEDPEHPPVLATEGSEICRACHLM